jgi:hypothetical protein
MSILQNKVLPVCLGSHRPIVQDDGDGDAGSLDTRLPVADVWGANDIVAPTRKNNSTSHYSNLSQHSPSPPKSGTPLSISRERVVRRHQPHQVAVTIVQQPVQRCLITPCVVYRQHRLYPSSRQFSISNG